MQSAREDVLNHTGPNFQADPLGDGDGSVSVSARNEEYLVTRARIRVTEASYDLFRALRAGDMDCAVWLSDEVRAQVVVLAEKLQIG